MGLAIVSHVGQVIAAFVATLCLVVLPGRAVAQVKRPFVIGETLTVAVLGAQPPPHAASRDSLTNGAIIGAVVGAAALGGFGVFLCKMQQEAGGGSCLPDMLRAAAIGAAIGAGAGLAIDAALTRHHGVIVRVAVRFSRRRSEARGPARRQPSRRSSALEVRSN